MSKQPAVPRSLSAAELDQRRSAAVTHGANSAARISAKARAHKRRFLRRCGLRAGDLDAVSMELLNLWARGVAQLDLREAGGVDSGKDYWVAYNGTRRVLEKLERRLASVGLDAGGRRDPLAALSALRRETQ